LRSIFNICIDGNERNGAGPQVADRDSGIFLPSSCASPLYQSPANPAVVEMTELNNLAQSNYDRFISTTSTPSREISTMEVGNPYPVRTRIWINAGNSNPLYRTFLEHSWVYLDPGETRNGRDTRR
jgi:hypothetical protein